MTKREHALLSASGATRWLNCPPSARLEDTYPDTTSEYAEEGTLAHSLAEIKLLKYFSKMPKKEYSEKHKEIKANPLYSKDMENYTDEYLEYIKDLAFAFKTPPHIFVETRVDYSAFAPEGFGTCDCLLIGGDTLTVVDFKYGRGVPVNAEDNPQMKLYALGALEMFSVLYDVSVVSMAVFQPRINNITSTAVFKESIYGWAEEIKPVAQTAFEGKGEFKAGEWCRFCKARHLCRTRTIFANEPFTESEGKIPPQITAAEAGAFLEKADEIKKWISDLEEWALAELLAGGEVPGWKAVEGRSNRSFEDTDKAFNEIIKAGFDEALLYERKPITLTAVEKLLGKKKFNETLSDHIVKPPGKPTLALMSDKREAITNKKSAADVFSGKDNENE